MLSALFSWLDNPAREARRLNRDAPVIIESATHGYPIERVREIAIMTIERLDETRAHLEGNPEHRDQVVKRFQQLHRECRRRSDQVGLTAYTLVIIYLRAQGIGEPARRAMEAIDEFTGRWAHALQQD